MKMFGFYVLLVALVSTCYARAATYNFYFNNNEQGDNSTSTPTVVVKDGKATKSGGDDEDSADDDSEETDDAVAAPAQQPQNMTIPKSRLVSPGNQTTLLESQQKKFVQYTDEPKKFHHFRLAADVFSGQAKSRDASSGWFDSTSFSESESSKSGLILSASFFFNKYAGLGLFFGGLNGIDAEFVPIHIGNNDVVEIAGLMGWHTAGFLYGDNGIHVGARALVNFTEHLGLNVAMRTSPFKDDSLQFNGGEIGLHVKL